MVGPRILSRRVFLRRSSQIAAGLAVPYLVPSRALAASGRSGANDRVGVGYIGTGRRSNQLQGLPGDAQIVATCDVNLNRAEALAAKKQCKAFQDYRKLLDQGDVDAVIVATPDHWHALPSIHACQAGKDVYCEKPLSLTIREGRAMVEAARKYKRVFQIGSQQRSDDANRTGCEMVRNGRAGKIHTVIGNNYPSCWEFQFPGQPVPKGLDWDMWCGQTEPRPYHIDVYNCRAKPGWASLRPYAGGEITGWGSHGFDQIQWALGMDDTGPVEVWCDDGKVEDFLFTEPTDLRKINDIYRKQLKCQLTYRYANGVVLKLIDGPQGGGRFIGDQGEITIYRGKFDSKPKELVEKPLGSDAIRLYKSGDYTDAHLRNWIDCVKSREKPVADVEIGHRSVTVCHLGNIARWLGRKLCWDPEKEVFPGDDEANALLERPQRRPYQLPNPV